MARENLLYSEIQSLSNNSVSRNDTVEYENDFDDHLNQLVKDLRSTLEYLKGRGAEYLRIKANLTGISPPTFDSFDNVTKLRNDGRDIVLEKMIPLVVQTKGFRKSADVLAFFKSYDSGEVIRILTDISLYSPYPSLDTDNRRANERKKIIFSVIEERSRKEISEKSIPAIQTGPENKDSRNENILSPSEPDSPGVNITGRFEFVNPNKQSTDMGMILCINQAGNWIEGVISLVAGWRVDRSISKMYVRFYAPVKNWNKDINLIYADGNFDIFSKNARLSIYNKDQLQIWYKAPDGTHALRDFWRVSSDPVLTERHFKTLNNPLVRQSQWFPLLTLQLENIVSFLKSSSGYLPIQDYKERGELASTTAHKIELRKTNIRQLLTDRNKGNVDAGNKLFYSFSQFVLENFHVSDHLLASFYCRFYLEQQVLIGVDKWRLSYLYALTRFLNIDGWDNSTVTRFLDNGITNRFSKEKHVYEIEANMSGLGGFYGFGGGGYYRGDFTIKCKQWEKLGVKEAAVLRISLWELGLGIGGGISLGKSFKAVATTNYLWKPDDFIGSYTIKKIEAGVSGYDVAGIGGLIGVMDLTSDQIGKSITFQVYDLDANVLGMGIQPENQEFESVKPKKAKAKIGVDASESLGAGSIWKGGKLPVAPDVVTYANDATLYGGLYAGGEKNHFKHNSAILTLGAVNALRKMCANEMALLTNKITRVEVTGHTDRSGREAYNERLSINRAKNVEQKIRDICGSSLQATIRATGMGEKAAKSAGKPDRRKNPIDRKVEIKINGIIVLRLVS